MHSYYIECGSHKSFVFLRKFDNITKWCNYWMSIVRILMLTNLCHSSRRQHHYMPLTRRLYFSANLSPSSLCRCLCTTSSIKGVESRKWLQACLLYNRVISGIQNRIKNIFIDDSSIWGLNNQYEKNICIIGLVLMTYLYQIKELISRRIME